MYERDDLGNRVIDATKGDCTNYYMPIDMRSLRLYCFLQDDLASCQWAAAHALLFKAMRTYNIAECQRLVGKVLDKIGTQEKNMMQLFAYLSKGYINV